MTCRGVRGATTTEADTAGAILSATRELMTRLIEANGLRPEEVTSAIFTVTSDLTAAFPAQAARELGWTNLALLDAQEIAVPGSLRRCIRVLIHWNTDRAQNEIVHVYLRGAAALRPDRGREGGETKTMVKIAFQGEEGAYSQQAIHQSFGREVETTPCRTFADIFRAVEEGRADYGILPVENAMAGSINQAYDLLLDHDLRIWSEVILRVHHALLAHPGVRLDDLLRVRSHPQALAQCERFLTRHNLEPVPAYDTAGAARELAAHPEADVGAIASALAAEIYSLEILAKGIEDVPWNHTRFFVLSEQDPPRAEHNKTSLVFTARHIPGALHGCLGEFAAQGINLTKIESRPRRNRPWHYIFYLDFEGHWQDPECEQALLGLLRRAAFVKMLGSYPAAHVGEME